MQVVFLEDQRPEISLSSGLGGIAEPKIKEEARIGTGIVKQMDIEVTDEELLFEKQRPVTFFSCVSSVLFRCKLSNIGPFKECCLKKICCCKWNQLAKFMGYILFSLTLASPYIARVLIFRFIEYEEWFQRKEAADKYDLNSHFSLTQSLLTYINISPWYCFFSSISLFVGIFFLFISVSAYVLKKDSQSLLLVRKVFFQSFCFRKRMDLHARYIYRLFVQNLVCPFNDGKVYCEDYLADPNNHQMVSCPGDNNGKKCRKKYNAGKRIFNFICWPFVVVFTTVACLCFHFPTTHIICRMFYQASHYSGEEAENDRREYQIPRYKDHTLSCLRIGKEDECTCKCKPECAKYIPGILLAMFCTIGMLCVLLLFSEVVAFVTEMAVFTLIGLLVHSDKLLEYVSLLFILLVYVFGCFKAVAKPYDELQNDIFVTVQRILEGNKEISSVTNACKHQQENAAFFYQTDNQIDRYECKKCDCSVQISENELIWPFRRLLLFINNEDCPLIPRKIFDDLCHVRTYGFPGPVHENTARAVKQLIQITLFLVFVFFAVQTFGPYYDTSVGTDMILIAASGLLPKLLDLSKGIKSKRASNCHDSITYYEIKKQAILNKFCQTWPVSKVHFVRSETAISPENRTSETLNRESGSGSNTGENNQSETSGLLNSDSNTPV